MGGMCRTGFVMTSDPDDHNGVMEGTPISRVYARGECHPVNVDGYCPIPEHFAMLSHITMLEREECASGTLIYKSDGGGRMNKPERLLLFSLDGFRYSLPLVSVASVISVVEITPLPSAPGVVDGVINMRGTIVPVINMRRRLRLPEQAISLSNRLVIAHTKKRTIGLMVDSVEEVVVCDELIDTERIFPGLDYLEGVTKIGGDVVFIHDLDKFLSLKEEALLVRAMDGV